MTINELRAKAAGAVAKAAQVRDNGLPWPEKQAAFDALVKEATDAQKEIQQMEVQQEQLDKFAALEQHYRAPVNNVAPIPEKAHVSLSESFARYMSNDKLLATEAKQACAVIARQAFHAYIRGDVQGLQHYMQTQGLGPREIHALLSTDNTLGGFLVNEDIRTDIIKAEAGYAVLAPLCRTENTNSNALVMPKLKPHSSDVRRTSGFAGKFQQEGYVTGGTAPTVQDKPTFMRERIPVHSWQPDAIELGKELLEDSGANIEAIVSAAIGECLAFDKDDKILSGTGSNEPEGILSAGITTVNSGGATSIAIGGILGMFSEVPAQYRQRSTWVMASRTMGAILQLNTGTGGVYLFPPNQWNNTILSQPVKFMDYGMDTATAAGGTTFTASAYPIIFGDFSRYIIAQRAALAIQRLVERFAPNIGILPTARFGGQVTLTDAFRIMKVAA
jgi:HK97 family phage major capsid protein